MVDQLQEIVVLFEQVKETFESQDSMLDLVKVVKPNEATVQNTDNTIWYPIEMQRPVQTGWDMSSNATDIIKEGYPLSLNDSPDNDVVTQRIDDLRNDMFMKEAIKASGKKLASNLNSFITDTIVKEGSLFYTSADTSGFDFITRGQVMMDERQLVDNMRYFLMNPTDARRFGTDLASRETVDGRPEAVWKKGYIATDVAGFDVMKGNFLPNITGNATASGITVTGDQSFAPEGFNTSTSANVDYRSATIAVSASANLAVGDKIKFSNSGTDVYAIGKDDKTATTDPMVFTVISKPSGTSIEVYPKPIANNDAGLSTLEKGYSNIDTQILNGATVTVLNTATTRTNLFWDKESVVVMGGNLPAEKFNLGGNRVVSDTLSNGLELYLVYYTNPATAQVSYRFMLWYGCTVCSPANAGIAVTS